MRNLVLLFDAFNKDEFEARVESLRIAYMNMKSCIRSLNYSEKKANEEKKRSSDTARRAGSTNNAGSSEGMFARLRWPTAWSSLEASGGVDVVAAAFASHAEPPGSTTATLNYREGTSRAMASLGLQDVSPDEVAFSLDAALQNHEEEHAVNLRTFGVALRVAIRRRLLRSLLTGEPTEETILRFSGLPSAAHSSPQSCHPSLPSRISSRSNDTNDEVAISSGHRETIEKLSVQLRRAVRMREYAIATELEENLEIVEAEAKADSAEDAERLATARSMTPARPESGPHMISRIKLWRGQKTERADMAKNASEDNGIASDSSLQFESATALAEDWFQSANQPSAVHDNKEYDSDDDSDRAVLRMAIGSDDHSSSIKTDGKISTNKSSTSATNPLVRRICGSNRQSQSLPRSNRSSKIAMPRARVPARASGGRGTAATGGSITRLKPRPVSRPAPSGGRATSNSRRSASTPRGR